METKTEIKNKPILVDARIVHDQYHGDMSIKSVVFKEGCRNIPNYDYIEVDGGWHWHKRGNAKVFNNVGPFEDCRNLESVKFPNSLDYIGRYAFKNCSSLTSITFPVKLSMLGFRSFNGCGNLKTVIFENPFTAIHWTTFRQNETQDFILDHIYQYEIGLRQVQKYSEMADYSRMFSRIIKGWDSDSIPSNLERKWIKYISPTNAEQIAYLADQLNKTDMLLNIIHFASGSKVQFRHEILLNLVNRALNSNERRIIHALLHYISDLKIQLPKEQLDRWLDKCIKENDAESVAQILEQGKLNRNESLDNIYTLDSN